MQNPNPSKPRSGPRPLRIWTLATTLAMVTLLALSGSVAASSGSGSYTASQRFPIACPGEQSAATAGSDGPLMLTEVEPSTASFGGQYGHAHKTLAVTINDDVGGSSTQLLVCVYDNSGNLVAGAEAAGSVVISTATAHYSFLAWVEAIYVETSEFYVLIGTSGSYHWEATN